MLKHDFIIWLKKNIFEAFQHSLLDIELILPEMSNIAMMQKLCGLIGVNTPLALVTVITHNTNTDIGKFLSGNCLRMVKIYPVLATAPLTVGPAMSKETEHLLI